MTAVTNPEQPQHMQALSIANRVRLARAALKNEIAAGERTAATVITQCPSEAETMTVFDLLCAQRHWGAYRSRKLCAVALITEAKTVGSLSDRQRKVLADLLDWDVA